MTILWIPVAAAVNARKSKDIVPGTSYTLLNVEGVGNFVLWVMWLVGAAIATVSGFNLYLINHICICLLTRCLFISLQHKWPTKVLAVAGRSGHILISLVAFSWISFGVLTLASVFIALHGAALYGGVEVSHAPLREKRESSA